ncbi:hypothetical protein ABVT39_006766, partial [Epinephelus coioides]
MPPCLTCLPSISPGSAFGVRALLYAPVSSLDSVQAFSTFQQALQQCNVQTFRLVPGAEPQLEPQQRAGPRVKVRSGVGLSVCVE